MQIKNMFEKKIDRDIKGVIKVGQSDEENVYQELDEYVVTKELLKHFRDFFDNYEKGINGYTDKMGVWISGFFGSGKSHFLKILSYLLKNSVVEGKRAIAYFTDGKKIEDPRLVEVICKLVNQLVLVSKKLDLMLFYPDECFDEDTVLFDDSDDIGKLSDEKDFLFKNLIKLLIQKAR